jgi:hypothetical protein
MARAGDASWPASSVPAVSMGQRGLHFRPITNDGFVSAKSQERAWAANPAKSRAGSRADGTEQLSRASVGRGAGSSNLPILTFPDFESLTCGSHHMQGPHVSDQKSGTAKSEDPIP